MNIDVDKMPKPEEKQKDHLREFFEQTKNQLDDVTRKQIEEDIAHKERKEQLDKRAKTIRETLAPNALTSSIG